jgi:hypothetical protein
MDCSEFRNAYARWWNQGPVNNEYPPQQSEWFGHKYGCESCRNWAKGQYCAHRGIVPHQHCCLDMAYAISHPVETLHQGPNRVLDWVSAWNEYLIPISYDGYKATVIQCCPWCGSSLPKSQRRRWYDALYALGFDDPGEQQIPKEFQSDAWWRNGDT